MPKLIMVLAGSAWQIPIVKKIKSMGFKTLVVNLYIDSPAFEYSDYHEVADILDKETCLDIARKYNIDAILSEQSDIAMNTVAYIANILKLPSIGEECASLYTNKLLMRDFSRDNNLPYPEYEICYTAKEVEDFFVQIKHEMIIKPLDSNSSRGVFKISNVENIQNKFTEALSFSKVVKAVIAERFIEGTEFTIDGLKTKGNHLTLAISEKKHYSYNSNIAYELFFSHYSTKYNYDKLKKINDRFVEQSDLPDGSLTHAEYKFENGKFYLIEIAARGGGNLVSSDIVPIMSGVDTYQYLINTALGLPNKAVNVNDKLLTRCAVLYFFDTPDNGGLVKGIEGVDFLEKSKNILTYKLNFKVGDKIERAKNDAERIGFYIAYADSRKELEDIMCQINDNFKIVF